MMEKQDIHFRHSIYSFYYFFSDLNVDVHDPIETLSLGNYYKW